MANTMNVQPLPDYGCLIDEGYTNTLRKKQAYLGEVYEKKEKDTIEATYVIKTDKEMEDFTQWWLAVLDYGALPFEINTLFMGYHGRLVCVMDNDLVVNYVDGAWKISMKLNVLYVIDDAQMS